MIFHIRKIYLYIKKNIFFNIEKKNFMFIKNIIYLFQKLLKIILYIINI